MSPLLKKEIRLLLPTWCVALLLAAVPLWLLEDPRNVSGVLWMGGIGAVILSVSAFGREFALGTSSSMLTQPVPRGRLFRSKTIVLCVALATVVAAFWFSYNFRVQWVSRDMDWRPWMSATERASLWEAFSWHRWYVLWIGVLAGFSVLAGGLWAVLVFRQMVASFWFAVLIPTGLFGLAAWIGSMLQLTTPEILITIVLLIYSALGCLLAWSLFKRAEDMEFSWGARTPPSLGRLAGLKHTGHVATTNMPVGALVRQEVSLHQTSLFASIVLLVLNLVAIGMRASGLFPSNSDIENILEPLPVFWFLIPLMLGASAIAEERRLGTLEARLCLPVARRRQFIVKFSVPTALGLIVAVGALLLTDALERRFGVSGLFGPSGLVFFEALWLPITCIGLTLLGFYASSLSKSALQALGTAILLALITVPTVGFMTTGDFQNWVSTAWIPGFFWITLGLTIIVLSYRNFGHLQCGLRPVVNDIFALALMVAATTTLTAGIYCRAWEFLSPLEPKHGPARISGSGRPQVVEMWRGKKLVILLPNGRLWVSDQDDSILRGKNEYLVPMHGQFVSETNWTAVVSSHDETIALRADGTLWSLLKAELEDNRWTLVQDEPRQIGPETNWTAIAAGAGHRLALKGDGTLWGWGRNDEFELLDSSKILTNGPVQVGGDSDWASVFARNESTVAVKRDGTVWQWGRVWEMDKDGNCRNVTCDHPTRWDIKLQGLREFYGFHQHDLLLYTDGNLCAVREIFSGNLLGTLTRYGYAQKPIPIGEGHKWKDLASYGSWGSVFALSSDGRLWRSREARRTSRMSHPSSHNDWIAVGRYSGSYVALAADGTLVFWDAFETPHALLPSRRPLANLNILEQSK